MGLAASQARYLFLTARKSGIEYQQMQIANDKISLSRQTEEVSEAYSKALNATKVTVGTTSGTTTDVTYSSLMNYGNTSSQYILVNSNEQVILSDDDAALIKNMTGSTGAAFSVTKAMEESYLASKMGISSTDADKYISSYSSAAASSDSNSTSGTTSISSILSSLSNSVNSFSYTDGLGTSQSYKWSDLYNSSSQDSQMINLLSYVSDHDDNDANVKKTLESIMTNLTKGLQNLGTLDSDALTTAYTDTINQFEANIDYQKGDLSDLPGQAAGKNEICEKKHSHRSFGVNAKNLLNTFFTYYEEALGVTSEDSLNAFNIADDSASSRYATKITTGSSSSSSSTGTTSNPQAQANFYLNQLFAIGSKGWVDESAVTDKSSLQTAITNNATFIEKYTANGWAQATTGSSSSGLSEEDDSTAQAQAEAKYKADSAKLNTKESELDLKEKNLETERSEIDTEIDSVKSVISKNVERSFKMFA